MAKQTQTLQGRIIEALEALGYQRVQGRTGKYVVLTRSKDEGFYFVGKNGALRAGKNVSSSVSLQGLISLDKLFAAAAKVESYRK